MENLNVNTLYLRHIQDLQNVARPNEDPSDQRATDASSAAHVDHADGILVRHVQEDADPSVGLEDHGGSGVGRDLGAGNAQVGIAGVGN